MSSARRHRAAANPVTVTSSEQDHDDGERDVVDVAHLVTRFCSVMTIQHTIDTTGM